MTKNTTKANTNVKATMKGVTTMKKESAKKEVTSAKKENVKAAKTETKPEEVKKEKKEKVPKVTVKQFDNDELKKMFSDNGLSINSKTTNGSKIVYNTFGTKSRVVLQNKAYQLLLTNGHKKEKEKIVDSDNDDVSRFDKFYNTLKEEDKAKVSGYDKMRNTKLAESELPREKTVKITDYDVLIQFLKFMSGFEENKVQVA